MTDRSFLIKKLNYYIENYDDLNEKERLQIPYFILTTTKDQMEELFKLLKESNENTNYLLERNKELTKYVEHFQEFITESNLNKRYDAYVKWKGVI